MTTAPRRLTDGRRIIDCVFAYKSERPRRRLGKRRAIFDGIVSVWKIEAGKSDSAHRRTSRTCLRYERSVLPCSSFFDVRDETGATMAKLSFKVYLIHEDPDLTCTEVRRFGVDADVATNFVYLREKLQTIFPDLRGKSFAVTWKGECYDRFSLLFFFFSSWRRTQQRGSLTSANDVVYQRSCALSALRRVLSFGNK